MFNIGQEINKRIGNQPTFCKNRFRIDTFVGFPLTLLTFLFGWNIAYLFNFTNDVINSKEFIYIDSKLAAYFFSIRYEAIAQVLFIFTKICSFQSVSLIAITIAFFLLFKKNYALLIAITISCLGSALSIYLSKNTFEINRPEEFAYYKEASFSFPSGHTTIAVAFYGLIVYYLIRSYRSYRIGIFLSFAMLAFLFLIGFSRLYLCVHYLSDVIAGFLLGSLWALLAISIFEWYTFKVSKGSISNSP